MTPTETAAILRQFMDWRRDKSNWPPSPMQIEKAIDAAIEMIDRLEAAEKERDALREQMERQEPARLVTPTAYRWRRRGSVMWQYGELTEETVQVAKEHNHEVQSLYALPGAQGEEK